MWKITYAYVEEDDTSVYEKYAWILNDSDVDMCIGIDLYEMYGDYPVQKGVSSMQVRAYFSENYPADGTKYITRITVEPDQYCSDAGFVTQHWSVELKETDWGWSLV